jgi:hypothetical protein
MKEKIIDYLIVKHLNAEDFNYNPNQRIKAAFILAKKEFKKLTEEQKNKLLKKINNQSQ